MDVYDETSPILVIPGYEEKIYRLYGQIYDDAKADLIARSLIPSDWESLLFHLSGFTGRVYLIAPSPLSKDKLEYLENQKFDFVLKPDIDWGYNRFLLIRE